MADEKTASAGAAETAKLPEPAADGAIARTWAKFHDTFLRILSDYPFLITIMAMALIAELGYAILNIATLPLHLDYDLRAPEATGWVLAAFLLVEAIFKSPFGALGDRIGRKPLLVLGPLWSGLCCFTMFYLNQPWEFVLVHGLNGLGLAAFWPSCFSTIAERVRRRDMTLAMSVFNLTYMLGIAFGPLAKSLAGNQDLREQLAARASAERVAEAERTWRLFHPHATKAQIALDHAYDKLRIGSQEWARVMRMHDYQIIERAAHYGITNAHRFPFLMVTVLFGITALIALVLAPGRMKSPPELEPDDDASAVLNPHATSSASLLTQMAIGVRTIPWMMVIAFTVFMGIGFVTPCIMPYVLRVYGISEREFGLLMLPVCAAIGGLALPFGRLGDKWGTTRSIRLGMSACSLGILFVLIQPLVAHRIVTGGLPALGHAIGSEWIMVFFMSIVGLGFVVANPAWMAKVSEMAPANQSGSVLGAALVAQGAGALIGNLWGGHLWAQYHRLFPQAPVVGCALFLGIGTLVTLWHIRPEEVGK